VAVFRVGLDARLNAYREGGIAEYTRRLAERLPSLDPTWQYLIIEHRKASARLAPAEAQRRRAFTPPHHRLEAWALGAELASTRLRLLHSPDFIPPRFGAAHHLITIHDLTFLHYPTFQTADSLRYYSGQIGRAARQAAHIFADSQATKADICALLGIQPEKITVHMLGVDERYQPMPTESIALARQRLALPSDYLLFVGTFEPRKNLPGLLRAYHQLRQQAPDSPPLVIAGRRGWLYEEIFAQVAELGLGQSVLWREDVAFADMPALYNGASLLVLPSFYEGFGFPPLEAMACGVPTVVSARGSLPEVVGQTGLLVDPDSVEALADAMRHALSDSNFRARSRAEGLARAKQFTWGATAQIVRDVYARFV
jgi:glycosyltransferase involved in cell wall biosynthesis